MVTTNKQGKAAGNGEGKGASAPSTPPKASEGTTSVRTEPAKAPTAPTGATAPAVDDGIDDGAFVKDGTRASGGFSGAMWKPDLCPQHTVFNERVIAEKMAADAAKGFQVLPRQEIGGTLRKAMAWQKMLYFLDVPLKGGGVLMTHIPEHDALYGSLGFIKWGAKVKLTYRGRGKAKPNQSAPHLYDVVAEKETDVLTKAREDALVVVRKQDEEEDGVPVDPRKGDDAPTPTVQ